ncbi:MAG: flagellar motor switch protein FliN [Myxococcota bacterium]|nr:flagellar motor switch protein FliN [Myxococcota bacterium]
MADLLSPDELNALLGEIQAEDGADETQKQDGRVDAEIDSNGPVGLDLSPGTTSNSDEERKANLSMILNIPVKVQVEIGRARMPVGEILNWCQGSVVELDHLATDLLDLTVNDRVVAHGEAVVVNENFGMRVLEVESVADRIRKL